MKRPGVHCYDRHQCPRRVVGLSLAVLVLAALWLGHAMWEVRHRTGRDPAAIRARARRGF